MIKFNTTKVDVPDISDELTRKVFTEYQKFKQDTLQLKHGKTAQVYLLYVQLVDYFLMFEYSIRWPDYDLFKYTLRKITNLFFAMNHQNYSRYMAIYEYKLNKIEETHPGLVEDSEECLF